MNKFWRLSLKKTAFWASYLSQSHLWYCFPRTVSLCLVAHLSWKQILVLFTWCWFCRHVECESQNHAGFDSHFKGRPKRLDNLLMQGVLERELHKLGEWNKTQRKLPEHKTFQEHGIYAEECCRQQEKSSLKERLCCCNQRVGLQKQPVFNSGFSMFFLKSRSLCTHKFSHHYHVPWILNMWLQHLKFTLLSFGLVLVPSLPFYAPTPPFWNK